MHLFSFVRFLSLLARSLEVCVVTALALRWIDPLVALTSGVSLPRAAVDTASGFSLLAILLLLAVALWSLIARQPRATLAAIRGIVYLILFVLSPFRMAAVHPSRSTNKVAVHSSYVCVMPYSAWPAHTARGS